MTETREAVYSRLLISQSTKIAILIENYFYILFSDCNSKHWAWNQANTQFDCVYGADGFSNFKFQE